MPLSLINYTKQCKSIRSKRFDFARILETRGMVNDFVAEIFHLPDVTNQAYHWISWVMQSFDDWFAIIICVTIKLCISIFDFGFSHQLFPSFLDVVLGFNCMLLVFDVAHSKNDLQPGFFYKAFADLVQCRMILLGISPFLTELTSF